MATETRTVRICDRCKSRSDAQHDPFIHGYSRLSCNISGRVYDGGWGGYKRTYDLCGSCTSELEKFLDTPGRGDDPRI